MGGVTMSVSLFKRSKPVAAPVPGAVYQRTIFNTVETARVLAVTQDGFPLPHVRYVARNDVVDGPDPHGLRRDKGAVRTLSLDSFTRLFGNPRAG